MEVNAENYKQRLRWAGLLHLQGEKQNRLDLTLCRNTKHEPDLGTFSQK